MCGTVGGSGMGSIGQMDWRREGGRDGTNASSPSFPLVRQGDPPLPLLPPRIIPLQVRSSPLPSPVSALISPFPPAPPTPAQPSRFILNLRGTAQLPRFSCPTPTLPTFSNPFSRSGGGPSRPFSSWRRSSGYGRVPAEPLPDGDSDEEEGLVGRFGLDSDDDEDE